MGIGHEIWQVEGNERAKVWGIDNIKVVIKEEDGETSIWLSTMTVSGF
jgi:hypothetical protein